MRVAGRITDDGGLRGLACDGNGFLHLVTRHEHARRSIAGLPGIAHDRAHARGYGSIEIGIFQNDVGRLAA